MCVHTVYVISAHASCASSKAAFVGAGARRYLEDFEHLKELGEGGFGRVFEARHRTDKQRYAVKRVGVLSEENNGEGRERLLREVAIASLTHQHIVRYYNVLYICLECVQYYIYYMYIYYSYELV